MNGQNRNEDHVAFSYPFYYTRAPFFLLGLEYKVVGSNYLPEFVSLDTISVDEGLAQRNHSIFRGGPYRIRGRRMKAQSLPGHVVEVRHSIKLVHRWGICVICTCFRSQFGVGCGMTCKSVKSPGDGDAEDYL
jgi:hypothetical protein